MVRGCHKRSYLASELRGCGPVVLTASKVTCGGRGELPRIRVRGGGQEELPHAPMPKARGGSQEEQSLVQGAEAVRAQEGLEELLGRVPYKTATAPFGFLAPVHVSVEYAQ